MIQCETLGERLESAHSSSALPEECDVDGANALCTNIVTAVLSGRG